MGLSAEMLTRAEDDAAAVNELYRNPLLAALGLDVVCSTNVRGLARIFGVLRRHGKMKALDPRTVSVAYETAEKPFSRTQFVSAERDEACTRAQTDRQ